MKYLGKIQNDKDLVTKEYVDRAASDLEGSKISKPSMQVPANYVPVSDGRGDCTWVAQQGGSGSVDYFAVIDGKVCAVYKEDEV